MGYTVNNQNKISCNFITRLALSFFIMANISAFSQSNRYTEACLTQNDYNDRYASYSPDGQWILFESDRSGNWDIYIMDEAGRQIRMLTESDNDERRPSWHPNGNKILFESDIDGHSYLYTLDLLTNNIEQLNTDLEDGDFIFASYSPDGRSIATSFRKSETKSHIALLDSNGTFKRWLTRNDWRNFYPRWTADGNAIVYFSRKDTKNEDDEIYILDLQNGGETRLTTWPTHNFCPSVSPDNKRIVYVTSMEDTRPEIYIMDFDGSNKTRITMNADGDTLPNWHPTENTLLITAYRNGNFEICKLNLP